jgi:hypothetical protein
MRVRRSLFACEQHWQANGLSIFALEYQGEYGQCPGHPYI